jgi:predicted RNA binding protein YcfA (HicA-like mRNA interferase family)
LPKMPRASGEEIIAALKRGGFEFSRQRGSHVTLWHPLRSLSATIPRHRHDLAIGTLHRILTQAQLTVEELLELLEG